MAKSIKKEGSNFKMNNKNILMIAPHFDRATEICYKIYEEAKESLKDLDELPFYLEKENANRENVELYLNNFDIIGFWDHGNDGYLVGQNGTKLIDENNVILLTGKEVWTVACLSAKNIGKIAVENGVKLWQGYDEVVTVTDAVPFFDLFQEALNAGFINRVLYNYSYKKCEEIQREVFEKNIRICQSMPENVGLFFAVILAENLKHLQYLSNDKKDGRLVKIIKKLKNFFGFNNTFNTFSINIAS